MKIFLQTNLMLYMELLLLYSFCFIQLCLCIYNVGFRKAIYIEFQPKTGQGKATKKKEINRKIKEMFQAKIEGGEIPPSFDSSSELS